MTPEQAVNVVTQVVNLALNKGVFANTQDVVVVHQALDVLSNQFQVREEAPVKELTPVKESE